jgi:hypothetical protein
MAYERSELLLGEDVPAVNIPTLRRAISIPANARAMAMSPAEDAERELEHLRSINARLRRELAALQLREAEALRLADRDGLTGLYNRRRMFELLNPPSTKPLSRISMWVAVHRLERLQSGQRLLWARGRRSDTDHRRHTHVSQGSHRRYRVPLRWR